MNRRNLLKTMAAAGTLPISGLAVSANGGDDGSLPTSPVVVDGLSAGGIREVVLEGMKKGGVHCTVAGGPSDFKEYALVLEFFDANSKELVHAKSVADIRRAHAEGKYSNVFCWQSATKLDDGVINSPLGGSSRTALRGFHEIGLRIVGLCYNVANAFGSGNLEPHLGLTRAGRRLVEEIHSLRIALDVGGHTGEQTTLDAIAVAPDMPVVCTHTNIAALADNARCVSDRVIDAIAGTGGVIGMTAVSDFHIRSKGKTGEVRRATLDDHIDQYDYIKRRVGVEHVGMGTDFVEGMDIPYSSVNIKIMPEDMLARPWRYVQGFEKIEQFPNLLKALKRRGWTDREIDLAMGENWLRVYERIWGA